jgi:Cu/Ag efflux protein CusF
MAALPVGLKADQAQAERNHEKTWTGTLTAVNAQNKTLTGKEWLVTKTFNLGGNCPIATLDKQQAALSDLRPGEKVKVYYEDVEGVLVARRIAECPLHYDGIVHSVEPKTGTVMMEEAPLYQPFRAPHTFRIASDCKLLMRNGQNGTLADVQPGDRISVLYELPGGSPIAYRIRDRSLAVIGTVEAIDFTTRRVQAREAAGEKPFAVANHCRIILSGEKTGTLKDLATGHRYKFTYEEVNGVNVLDRIAPVQGAKPAETASRM